MLKRTLLAASLLFVGQASAALVEADWKTEGDKLAFYDTETNLSYLDLSQTLNLSIDDVTADLSTTFSGWRLPTESELDGLFGSLVGDASGEQSIDDYEGDITTYTSVDENAVKHFASVSGGFTQVRTDNYEGGAFVKVHQTYGFFTNDQGYTSFYGTWLSYWNDGQEEFSTMKVKWDAHQESLGYAESYAKTEWHGVYLVQTGLPSLNSDSPTGDGETEEPISGGGYDDNGGVSNGGGGSTGGAGGSGGSGDIVTSPDGEVSDVPVGLFGAGLFAFALFNRRKNVNH
tara:strand:+ start:16388 stop:17251 length:864 start_codon:yes stop_codon:yes gene_type:complete